jgi:hypothetical protein
MIYVDYRILISPRCWLSRLRAAACTHKFTVCTRMRRRYGSVSGLTKSPVEAGDQGACSSTDPSSFVPSQDGLRSSVPLVGSQLDLEAALSGIPMRLPADGRQIALRGHP